MRDKVRAERNKPILISGDIFVDDRGETSFVNEFYMQDIKRFYTAINYKTGFIRAWHAHRNESKYITVVNGAAVICAVKIDNWKSPSKDTKIYRYVLSESKPAVLFVPSGYANGYMGLVENTKLIFFSTASLQESQGDDVRYDARYWDPWQVTER